MAPFGSVNESTWEHLKLFYWPGVAMAAVQHAYLRHRVNNFWLAKGVSLLAIALGVSLSFYTYLGIVIPIEGKGSFLGTFATAVFGVGLGQCLSYRLLVGRPRGAWTRTAGIALIVALGAAFVVFTFAPPRIFLFENFAFYRYSGEYGILADYTPYLVFR
ncbi:MAG: hypothetical protein FJ038_05995 [Chloroflexi bacterium]|nr:hypothetical protein [Chloroflexota bacterium]